LQVNNITEAFTNQCAFLTSYHDSTITIQSLETTFSVKEPRSGVSGRRLYTVN